MPLTLNEFQTQAKATSFYKDQPIGEIPVYPMLGLAGEVGEVSEQLKKAIRDDGAILTPERKAKLKLELSDCLWYLSDLAGKLGFTLEEVAQANIDKLASRRESGRVAACGGLNSGHATKRRQP